VRGPDLRDHHRATDLVLLGRAALLVAGAATVLAAPARARAEEPLVGLPSPTTPLTATPPLVSGALLAETRVPGRVESEERIAVGLDSRGRPRSVVVRQRLQLDFAGDYVFGIPGPVERALPGPGSQSNPGVRSGLVIWQGFSPGRRLLVADVDLDAARAGALLPVRVRVHRAGATVRVTVTNATATTVRLLDAIPSSRKDIDQILRSVDRSRPAQVFVRVRRPPGPRVVRIEAPLRIEGALVFGNGAAGATVTGGRLVEGRVRFSRLLGAGRPLSLQVTVKGVSELPLLSLTARPLVPADSLRPDPLESARELFARAGDAFARFSRVRQYTQFLVNPDPGGSSSAVYELRTLPAAAREPASPAAEQGRGLRYLLGALGALVAACAAAVLWAHS
jgi:hypothetical protein